MKIRPSMRLTHQRGVTLLVALIMLVLLTLLALTSANVGRSTIQVVGNMQSRDESTAAARQTIDEVISSKRFTETPADSIGTTCEGSNTKCVDVNGDGTTDVKVALTPAPVCVTAQAIRSQSINLANTATQGCVTGEGQRFDTPETRTGDSLCANSIWEINAVATDAVTEATVQVTQGVTVMVAKDDVETTCL